MAVGTHTALWGTAVGTFGVGDVVTTAIGRQDDAVVETSPVGKWVLENGGLPGLVAWKALTLAGFGVIYTLTPQQWRIGIPLGLTVWGSAVTAKNALLIRRARTRE